MTTSRTVRNALPKSTAALRLIRHASRPATITVLVFGTFCVTTLSPLTLTIVARRDINWSKLSNVGQSYGAISAILSAFAVLGVTISLLLQVREALSNRRYNGREAHSELTRMAMEDPAYMECWGPIFGNLSHDEKRQFLYVNLLLSHLANLWETGDLPEVSLRIIADDMFGATPARIFWRAQEDRQYTQSNKIKMRRFRAIIDESYHAAIESGSPAAFEPPKDEKSRASRRLYEAIGTVATVGTIGALAYRLIRRKNDGY
jgi:hypothetical protein